MQESIQTQPQIQITLSDLAQWGERIERLEREIAALRSDREAAAKRNVLTVREAAAEAGVSTAMVYEFIRSGRLPAFKLNRDGRAYHIYRADLEAMFDQMRAEQTERGRHP